MQSLSNLKKEIEKLGNQEKANFALRFFRTGKGEYGEGDVFLGLTVFEQRKIAAKYTDLGFLDIQKLLDSKYHEFRLVALVILMHQYKRADKFGKKKIYDLYLKNTKRINNWDLVDISASNIVGDFLLDKDRKTLYKLAMSDSLWEKRISVISTLAFIRKNEFEDTISISKILLFDKHDLIHKAVGWMLREVGKRDLKVLCKFLDKHYKIMPRTMLRYSLEKLEKNKKEFYMGRKLFV